ncbi:glycoside hydrolase family 78 protein [Sphingomonas cannabina]|uniref:family 78 glycoside hydrolase catalytic domain n=1 Tax=Sphingomonas cannabina TaxID=2899123 RepID=UPI001F1F1C74|nr:family 78 glycoside hydrolase catalytic domain [Sphingomonas cannabina]UIJ44227.1 glycoside hydrolase family 78 protein [Sphingomonas cannabina]
MPYRPTTGTGRGGSHIGRLVLLVGAAGLVPGAAAEADAPSALKVEYAAEPLGIDEPAPRLAWRVPTARQAAYRIRVAASPEELAQEKLVWDSGRVASDANAQVAYAGPPLASRTRYWWQVATWDGDGRQSGWSRPGWWEMGLLRPADWSARWIAGPKRTDHDWADLTFESELTMTGASLDLIFRARPVGKTYGEAYVWTLAEEKDGPVLIERVRRYPGGVSSAVKMAELKRVPLAGVMLKGVRHRVTITARGRTITTAIDGKTVDTLTDDAQAHGTIGYAAKEARAAVIHRVRVVGSGSPAFATRFEANDNAFTGGRVEAEGLVVSSGLPNVDIVLPIESPAPLLRRAFTLPAKGIASARLYVAGAGWPKLHLNGVILGASAMGGGFTAYDKRVLYYTYDVTDRLRAGANVLGAELGRGWYGLTDPNEWYFQQAPWHGEPAVKAQLEVTFADGSRQTIATDESWKTISGPTLADSIHRGERYDARLLPVGWDKPGFSDRRWMPATPVEGPKGELHAANLEPIAPVETVAPVSLKEVKPGVWVYDFGRIFAGWVALDVTGPGGRTVSMAASERVGDDGLIVPASGLIDAQLQTDRYTLAGKGRERWEPSFGYHGFRYVQLEGFPGTPTLATLTGKVAHSAVASTGSFASANPLLGEIDQAAIRTILNNMHGFQTDTPTYEKNGWTGDAQASAGAAVRSLDVARVWSKWLADFPDAQAPSGELPEIVPATPYYGYENTPGWNLVWGPTTPWDVAAMILPWELYQTYGDTRVLERMHEVQRRLVDYTATKFAAPDYRGPKISLSEWSAPGSLDFMNARGGGIDAVTSAYFFLEAKLLAQSSQVIGKAADAERYGALAEAIRAAYNKRYWDDANGWYRTLDDKGAAGKPTQIQNVLPLAFGMAPAGREQSVADAIAADVAAQGLKTGVYGTRYLLDLLSDHGHADLAYKLATRTEEPSWGYWLANGHKTMFESWSLGSRSRDHHYFGSIADWLRQRLAGLRPGAPGYRTVQIRPAIPAGLAWASATMATPQGEARSAWKVADGRLTLTATIPMNSAGEVWVSTGFGAITGVPAGAARVREERGAVVYRTGAGTFEFTTGGAR